MTLYDLIRSRIVLFDGSLKTLLEHRGATKPGECMELMSITRPLDIFDAHVSHLNAGADIVCANTRGANELRLSHFGLDNRTDELITSAIALSREAVEQSGKSAFVAAPIGPTGELFLDDRRTPRLMYDSFCRQISAAAAAGADLLLIDSMNDLSEARLALLAARASCKLPILCSFTLEPDAHTYAGNPPEVLALVAQKLGATMLGANCGLGPAELFPAFSLLNGQSAPPVFVLPNAEGSSPNSQLSPEAFALEMLPYVHDGAAAIGGCCHATPEHTRELRKLLDQHHGHARQQTEQDEYICSATKRLPLSALDENAPIIALDKRTAEQTQQEIAALAATQDIVHIDLVDWNGEEIRCFMQDLLPQIGGTPLAFHINAAHQANAALFAYPGIAAVYAQGEAYRVLKAAARYGAEVVS
ncbi:homocysteine S-methyltransferase family protein [Eubacteriales bacterium OttesenSCG-928-K08]|nr:homocysteine S-methyltransferase family protein [Eubacteriales bacterium OttesenSCG-928-K08]